MRRRLVGYLVCLGAGLGLGAVLYTVLIGIPYGPTAKGDLQAALGDRPARRVLFVGNSLTYWNGMPSMVRKLAQGDPGAGPMLVVQFTAPGWDLKRASDHDGLRAVLEKVRWDDVVLQERSTVWPPDYARVRVPRGRTVIFGLWGSADYAGAAAYYEQTLPAVVAPVGVAEEAVTEARPGLRLDDGTGHPNRAGSFLIACVFYAVLTGRDPRRSRYSADLDAETARLLAEVAWEAYRGVAHAAA